jgi:hypothetical protein
MLVPKEVKLEHSTSAIKELTDEELEQAIQAIRAMLAAQAEKTKIIEATFMQINSASAPLPYGLYLS